MEYSHQLSFKNMSKIVDILFSKEYTIVKYM